MKKILIILITTSLSCLTGYAQNLSDSSQYYLNIENSDILPAIKFCLNDIYKYKEKASLKGGLIKIEVSNIDIYTMKISHFYPKDESVDIMPDYYSYIEGKMILWYIGMTNLTKPSEEFENFISKTFYNHMFIKHNKMGLEDDSHLLRNEGINLDSISGPIIKIPKLDVRSSISAEEAEKMTITTEKIISSTTPSFPVAPIYIIKITGKYLTIDKYIKIICSRFKF